VFYCQAIIDKLVQGVDTDPQMIFHMVAVNFNIELFGFNSVRDHWLVTYQQQRTSGDTVGKTDDENRCRFHIYGHAAHFTEVFLEFLIIFPYTPVGRINGPGPVIMTVVADGG